MFYQTSFTNQAEDYLQTLLQNRRQNQYNDQSPQLNQQEVESDFTPFMKRHSSSGDSYVRDHQPHYDYNSEQKSAQDYQHQHQHEQQISMDMERENAFSKRFTDPHNQEDSKVNKNFDDSFLDLVDQHLSNIQKEQSDTNALKQNESTQLNQNRETISISKQQISHALLQNQSVIDSIQLTNLLPTRSIAKIINSPFQFRLLNAKNKFIKRDEVQISLEPYQTVEIEFQIKRRQSQIGNIYQTLKIETYQASTEKKLQLQKKYLKFQITFVKPKLQVTFLGKTTVKRIQQHKIAHLQLYPNQLNQYFINFIFSQDQFSTLNSSILQRIECQISAKGYISVHPSSIILYRDEPLKIVLRKLSQVSGVGKNSVIIIKPLNSSLVYVVGVKCMDKKLQKKGQQENVKMSKFAL